MRARFLAPIAALLLPFVAGAQGGADSSGLGAVSGTVYDSVGRAPIAGAVVQLVSAAAPSRDFRDAISDANGRYLISGVLPGRYLIGFQHAALDSIALESPVRLIDIRAGERAKADLAVPSPARILVAICRDNVEADSTGLMIGMLRDARTHSALDSGTVQAQWQELTIDATGIHRFDREVMTTLGDNGWFALCGVPGGVEFAVRAWRNADTSGVVAVTVPVGGFARRDILLGGLAVVHGSVVDERNRPIANARVTAIGRERSVSTDSSGAFRLGEVPAGTLTLETRALGYAMEQRPLQLSAGRDTSLAITLTTLKRVMDTIRVVATRIFDRDSRGFLRRKRLGGGYFFDEATIERRRPFDLLSLLQTIPSLQVRRAGMERAVVMRGGLGFGGYCVPDLFLNGMRMPGEMVPDLDLLARPEELAGVEVYRGGQTPAEFHSFSGCGVIVIWTRTPPRRRR